jgi:Ca-activated chloride channel family protein
MLTEARLATELNVEDGTAIGMGLANAANMLKDAAAPSRVVILLTDGVNNAGEIDPLTAAEAARALGIKVYTVGMGRPGPVPVPVADMFGRSQVIMQESALDETVLQTIADRTGGRYYRAEDTAGLQQIYDEISTLEQTEVEIETFTNVRELMALALVPGALLLLAELALRHTLFRALP